MRPTKSQTGLLTLSLTSSDQECQLQRLLLIQSRIAESLVPLAQVFILQTLAATRALRDSITCQLEMHATEEATTLLMDAEGRRKLAENGFERSCLDASRRAPGVAVHGIALPDDLVSRLTDGIDMGGKELVYFAFAVARDERDFADLLPRVDYFEELGKVFSGGGGSYFDSDGILEAAEVLDMCVVWLSRAVTNPEEVSGSIVIARCLRLLDTAIGQSTASQWRDFRCGCCLHCRWYVPVRWMLELARKSLFILKEKAFVRGEEIHGLQLPGSVGTDCSHKAKRFRD